MATRLRPVICSKCGIKSMRPQNSLYCVECKPVHVPVPPKDCRYCGIKLIGYHPNCLHCNDCKGRAKKYWHRRRNDNEVARQVTRYAVKVGFLLHPSNYICMDCKRWQADCYDHRDYSKPLEVDAVCRYCNAKRGKGIPLHLVSPENPEPKPKTKAA